MASWNFLQAHGWETVSRKNGWAGHVTRAVRGLHTSSPRFRIGGTRTTRLPPPARRPSVGSGQKAANAAKSGGSVREQTQYPSAKRKGKGKGKGKTDAGPENPKGKGKGKGKAADKGKGKGKAKGKAAGNGDVKGGKGQKWMKK